jgi:NitT/TauT family transport system substrate-binding protein
MRNLRLIAALAVLALLSLAVPPSSAQTPLLKIRLGGVPTDDLTPVVYAVDAGLYKKAGLDVEVIPTSSGTAATTAAVTGAYEMGKGSAIASFVAHLKNLPLVLTANGAIWNPAVPFNELLVAADSTTKTGADLNGKTIGVPALEIPNTLAAPALIAHRIDADAVQDPELAHALAAGGVKSIAEPYSAISTHFAFGVYFANKDWAEAHPQAMHDFTRITYQAAAYANSHHAETAALMSQFSKVPVEVYQKMARVESATSSDPALLQPFIDAAAKYKLISNPFPAKDLFF